MNKKNISYTLALKIWFTTSVILTSGIIVYNMNNYWPDPILLFLTLAVSLGGSVPVLVILLIAIPYLKKESMGLQQKIWHLVLIEVTCISFYALASGYLRIVENDFLSSAILTFIFLFTSALVATFIFYNHICALFMPGILTAGQPGNIIPEFQYSSKKYTTMETITAYPAQSQSNKTLIKGLVAGGLILLMLIPTIIIKDLITEREARQKEVVQEVSAKWANAQTVSGPYLVVPYTETAVDNQGKPVFIKKELIVLSKNMNVNGEVIPENRPRSIYKVLLYKSNIDVNGLFQPKWPTDIDTLRLDLANAKLCFGLSDFKGIEEEIYINFNKRKIALNPGLPENNVSDVGLSAPVAISIENLNEGIHYDMNVKLKGSGRLHFMPLSANSSFALNSVWPSPSFDGNTLPNERQVNDNGFTAKWKYNQANLPYGMVVRNTNLVKPDMSFGVSMVQPADQYNKTMRSVKYAVLIIGLTFALFFIVELMQGKPFLPVQYVLVGLALVIFYTLLLAISEYLLFDHAYLIAAIATVLLISLYAKSHFRSWKTAALFATVLGSLYGFIFILLRLEDTALLVGSIGLFIVLAIVMYVSRRVDWYGSKHLTPAAGKI